LSICAALLAACSSVPTRAPTASAPPTQSSKYYKDDGPGDSPPANLEQIPDAVPRLEPLHRYANRPYTVLGRDYVPAVALRNYKERGIASWYGRKFHGQKTSIGETYDMYGMTAAHPTLPLPSFARVTNVATGKSVIVRVNDRGPFLHGRIIDLSFAAASKVGIAGKGSGEVEVEAIVPGDDGVVVATAPLPPVAAPVAPVAASLAASTAPLRPAEAPPAAISRDSGGFAVQLGAFQNLNNAQTFLAHAEAQLGPAQVTPKVREANGLYRVYVGPYPDRDEARRVADRITTAFGFATAIAPH
jgi:rare lipoprotein A